MMENIPLIYNDARVHGYTVSEGGVIYSPYGNVLTIYNNGTFAVKIDGVRKVIRHHRALMESYGIVKARELHRSVGFRDLNPQNLNSDNMYWAPFNTFKKFEDNMLILEEHERMTLGNWREKTKLKWYELDTDTISLYDYIIANSDNREYRGGYPESVWDDMVEDGWTYAPPPEVIDQYLYRRSYINNNRDVDFEDYELSGCNAANTEFNLLGLVEPHIADVILSVNISELGPKLDRMISDYNRNYTASFKFPMYTGTTNCEYYHHLLIKLKEFDRRWSEATRARNNSFISIY